MLIRIGARMAKFVLALIDRIGCEGHCSVTVSRTLSEHLQKSTGNKNPDS